MPEGFGEDRRDVTVMNNNGIAADPKGRAYDWGGEINTPPSDTPCGQVDALRTILSMHPGATVNHRSNLHVHIRVPGLRDDLASLKQIARYNAANLKIALSLVEPIPAPTRFEYADFIQYTGAVRRYKRRLRSHHMTLSGSRTMRQLAAQSSFEFFSAEVPVSAGGKPQWHLGIRTAINLRQLQETDTIEFRHFPGTLNADELLTCVEWCRDYLDAALHTGERAQALFNRLYRTRRFPKFPQYIHALEERYRATCHDGTLTAEQIAKNIVCILGGKFN